MDGLGHRVDADAAHHQAFTVNVIGRMGGVATAGTALPDHSIIHRELLVTAHKRVVTMKRYGTLDLAKLRRHPTWNDWDPMRATLKRMRQSNRRVDKAAFGLIGSGPPKLRA